ncbi:MAG: hypothetical protein OXU96_05360, partial [Gammaproteobacteria bacterium]|nr:hypothetical protein [Gammaproteobacteria bacterium]
NEHGAIAPAKSACTTASSNTGAPAARAVAPLVSARNGDGDILPPGLRQRKQPVLLNGFEIGAVGKMPDAVEFAVFLDALFHCFGFA